MYIHTNNTKQDLILPGVCFLKAGQSFKSERRIENPNLTIAVEGGNEPVVGVQSQQPNVVTEANLVSPEPVAPNTEESE